MTSRSAQTLNFIRLVGSSGANRSMEAELKRIASRGLGGRLPKATKNGTYSISYPFDADLGWLAARYARTPSRVVWDLFETNSQRLEPLYSDIYEYLSNTKPIWLKPNLNFSVEVVRSHGFPAGPLQIRGTVKNALIAASESLSCPLTLNSESPQLYFRVEADEDRVVVSIDLGGKSLHRRGLRSWTSEASLKETLAAQMLILSRWDPRTEALIDPMAGAGTIVIEAAGAAVGQSIWPTGTLPPAHHFPPFDSLGPEQKELFPGSYPPIAAIEVHTPTHRNLLSNLESANLMETVVTMHGDFRDAVLDRLWSQQATPERGLVIVNPPYGERLEQGRGQDPELDALYEDLHEWWRALDGEWRIAVLGPGRLLKSIMGSHPRLDKPMKNGPLSVSLLVYDP